MAISLDDLVDGLVLTTKAAYAAAVVGCTSSFVRGTGLCAPSFKTSLPWPLAILLAIAFVSGALYLNIYLSQAWENELGVFGTRWVLNWRFGQPKLPPSGPMHGTPAWWKQQVVVVTGGAGGLGWATARRVLKLGARVAVWDIVCPKALEQRKPGEGIEADSLTPFELERTTFVRCNVANSDAVISAAAEVHAKVRFLLFSSSFTIWS